MKEKFPQTNSTALDDLKQQRTFNPHGALSLGRWSSRRLFYPGSFWRGILCCQSWNPIRCYLSVVDDKLDRFRGPRGACELKQKSTLHNTHVPSLTTGVSHRMESLSTCQYLLRQLPPSMMTVASSHQDFFLFFCFFKWELIYLHSFFH